MRVLFTMEVIVQTRWDVAAGLLVTRLAGTCDLDDVRRWSASLDEAIAQMEDGSRFKLLSDLTGYEFAEVSAHREMRSVLPRKLAEHGFRTALLDLFEGVQITLREVRGISCAAYAHVHHDGWKMNDYELRLSRPIERFFSDRTAAEAWLRSIPLGR